MIVHALCAILRDLAKSLCKGGENRARRINLHHVISNFKQDRTRPEYF